MQVEQRFDPQLRGRPCAVVQYNNYEARSFGVARGMWASEARALCPELLLARVPEARGKADLSRYREASAEVMEVLSRFAAIERASIDEAYLDLTGSARDRLRELRGRPLAAQLLPTTFVQGLAPNVCFSLCRKGWCIQRLWKHLSTFCTVTCRLLTWWSLHCA
uniref:UmuC domain-containing protein n=1 Tax=Anas zonorhyncha TaxID=75864 RepID=A0A8B9V1T5_9AVES